MNFLEFLRNDRGASSVLNTLAELASIHPQHWALPDTSFQLCSSHPLLDLIQFFPVHMQPCTWTSIYRELPGRLLPPPPSLSPFFPLLDSALRIPAALAAHFCLLSSEATLCLGCTPTFIVLESAPESQATLCVLPLSRTPALD